MIIERSESTYLPKRRRNERYEVTTAILAKPGNPGKPLRQPLRLDEVGGADLCAGVYGRCGGDHRVSLVVLFPLVAQAAKGRPEQKTTILRDVVFIILFFFFRAELFLFIFSF